MIRDRRPAGDRGYTVREMLLVLLIVGLFTAIVVPLLAGDKVAAPEEAAKTPAEQYQDTLRAVLTRLVNNQRAYRRINDSYLDDLAQAQGYAPRKPASVDVFITAASPTGWRALATHPFFNVTCGVSHGTGVRPGEVEDAPTCGTIQEPALVAPQTPSDSAIQRLPWAGLALTAPRRLPLGTPATISLVLDAGRAPPEPRIYRELPRASTDSFVAGIVTVSPSGDSSARVEPYAVRVTPRMEAVLVATGARVDSAQPSPRVVGRDSTVWRWTVTPTGADTARFAVRVRMLADSAPPALAAAMPREVASLTRTAIVNVRWADRLGRIWREDRAALLAVAVGLIAVAAMAIYAGRKRPEKAVPRRAGEQGP